MNAKSVEEIAVVLRGLSAWRTQLRTDSTPKPSCSATRFTAP